VTTIRSSIGEMKSGDVLARSSAFHHSEPQSKLFQGGINIRTRMQDISWSEVTALSSVPLEPLCGKDSAHAGNAVLFCYWDRRCLGPSGM
jgi:hypothetical protein